LNFAGMYLPHDCDVVESGAGRVFSALVFGRTHG
jgi:hypothetical protein